MSRAAASLIRRAAGYEADIAKGRSFWQVIPERYGLSLDITGGSLANIPTTGPLVLIANHPYGILDGLMMGHMLDAGRGEFPHARQCGVPPRRGAWTASCCRSTSTRAKRRCKPT